MWGTSCNVDLVQAARPKLMLAKMEKAAKDKAKRDAAQAELLRLLELQHK
ncbi:MAG: hypothetical protein PHH47_10245 [Gallionella sp.]|nr:hypothetical protein [Gallionella sp.]MDD4946481.1 hypothetical protein [Gallionella sp.]